MQPDSQQIIADRSRGPREGRAFVAVLAAALACGLGAAAFFWQADLTLSHYDARAHLVVARRIFDSLTPGWRQIGAVWLPLPHVLNALPVQIDWAYRTGLVAVAFSVGVMAWGLAAMGALVARRTGSIAGGMAAALAVLLNPNVLYLQSTPMTEPLLFGLSFLALDAVDRWVDAPTPRARTRAGLSVVALMLTRYEGWFIGCGLVAISVLAQRARGHSWRDAASLLPYPVGAVVGFFVLSKATVGAWFVTGGFYDATNASRGDAVAAARQVYEATRDLAGLPLIVAGSAGAVACLLAARRRLGALLPLALTAAAALPWIAFHAGHPHRVRYMVPLVVASGTLAGFAIGLVPRRLRGPAAVALLAAVTWSRPPLDPKAPMLLEAQWERPYRLARAPVTGYLEANWDGTPILASMGSLAHYMQDTSAIGLDIRNFVHEGNFALWEAAVAAPHRHVRWVLIEERAEGGDQLAALARRDPGFLSGFTRVASGGGAALYYRALGPRPRAP
jgi:hypothetical protein